MFAEIKQIFPDEEESDYYVPSKNGRSAGGQLYSSFCNLKRFYNKFSEKKIEESEISPECELEKVKPMIEYLKFNYEIDDTLKQFWRETHAYRMQCLKTITNIEEYFNIYKCIRLNDGLPLLLMDFNLKFPEKSMKLYENFNDFMRKVQTFTNDIENKFDRIPVTETSEYTITSFSYMTNNQTFP